MFQCNSGFRCALEYSIIVDKIGDNVLFSGYKAQKKLFHEAAKTLFDAISTDERASWALLDEKEWSHSALEVS